ncbi:exonuclease [Aquicoccus sp. G2-2]|uniref:exonuclease n=1 Tax=Aquicoccus sp. G2-2 TaxID=3092120 RepID=UPI002AE0ACE2|nr:exonuclease [Aquicoccus sp. G2-2]MEA1114993.1 exonuclease [Aquicoccus sp. G2-2]
MRSAVVWDVEFLTDAGAPQRFWCGPDDPDPVLVQIGAVKLGLEADFPIGDRFEQVVIPRDRAGAPWPLSDLFTRLTGLNDDRIAKDGVELGPALAAFSEFAAGDTIWAWGNDEIFAVAISCYLAGIAPPIPATQFGNATRLLVKAGVATDDVQSLRSNTLCAHFGISDEGAQAHDALGDAQSVAFTLQHFLRNGRLQAGDFAFDRGGQDGDA